MNVKLVFAIVVAVLALCAAALLVHRRSTQSMEALQSFAIDSLRWGHPGWQLEREGKNGITLHIAGQVGRIYLDNILREVGTDRARARKFVEQSAQELSRQLEMTDAGARTPNLQEIKLRLRPMLVPQGYANSYDLAARAFTDDISETLVIDYPQSTRYVRNGDVKQWGVEFEIIRQIAHDSLWQSSRSIELRAEPPQDPTLPGKYVALTTHDGYDAARLVLPEVRQALARELGSPFYVAVPNRDFLVAWSNDFAFFDQFAAQVRENFTTRSHQISPKVYRVQGDRIESVR